MIAKLLYKTAKRSSPSKGENLILITGSSGFLGSNVTKYFVDKKNQVLGLDLANPPLEFPSDSFTFRKCDLTDRDIVFKLFEEFKPKHVIHLAFVTLRKSIYDEFLADAKITLNMLEASSKFNVDRMVLMSSSMIYGWRTTDKPVDEAEKPDPRGTYGKAKVMAEFMAKQYLETHNLPVTVFRGFEIYGPVLTIPSIVRKLVERAVNKEPLQLYCYGRQKTDFTYAEDVAQAMEIVLKNPKAVGQLFNVGSGKAYTYEEFAKTINKLLPCKIELLPPRPNEHPFYIYSTIEKLKGLGFSPKFDILEGLKRTIDWMLSQHA
jgi:nucleoside-diphosphate-sugar epimerase